MAKAGAGRSPVALAWQLAQFPREDVRRYPADSAICLRKASPAGEKRCYEAAEAPA